LSAKTTPFTRIELLGLFRCEPWVEDILNSDKPHRAKEYWAKAIRKLKAGGAGVIGYYNELNPLPNSREGGKNSGSNISLLISDRAARM
jgi:hypothetical protein